MPLTNSPAQFGSLTRALHWLTALLILTAIPLGLIANRLPYDTAEALAQKAQLFSLHKTLGVAAFFVAALRILWALTQTRPQPLHPERRLETMLAEGVHWMLYISLLAVPLTGWVHHAAVTGFAPILWPLGQGLPFVPQSEAVANTAAALHWVFTKLLALAILLHIAGALKHHLVDRDATLRRMWSGAAAVPKTPASRHLLPAALALTVYAAGAVLAVAITKPVDAAQTQIGQTGGNWQVTDGTLAFSVKQMGADVSGSFATWSADITFDEASGTGSVVVTIDTASLTLGTVTKQAMDAQFFDTANHPTAVFTANIAQGADQFTAEGTLALRAVTQAISLPFSLVIDGTTATMSGTTTLDRRDFGMGSSYPDEASVGFAVTVDVALTATRKP
ncbi:MAG: cytochrome b/b6 domain-containing protein [Paracoccaceae bacterium]